MNCPVCDCELIEKYRHAGEHGLEENKLECQICLEYAETYAYGATEITIGDFMTGYSHCNSKETREAIIKKVQQVAELYRKDRL